MIVIAEAAAAPAEDWWKALLNTGAIGVMLLWLMFRVEKLLKENTKALHLNTVATTIVVLDSKHKDTALCDLAAKCREQAEAALRDESKTVIG